MSTVQTHSERFSAEDKMIEMSTEEITRPKLNDRPRPGNNLTVGGRIEEVEDESTCSATAEGANIMFFGDNTCGNGSYTNSYTWKSRSVHRAEEFARIQRLVTHVAPEQFRDPAKPSDGPCNIVPTSVLEHVEHCKDMLAMAAEQMERNVVARREARRIRREEVEKGLRLTPRSGFGIGAKVYADGLSPVLCRETIWSNEHELTTLEFCEWPTLTELQDCGDKRENDSIPTRCGRYLPPPRWKGWIPQHNPMNPDMLIPVQGFMMKRPSPMDEHGPIFSSGPSPVEIISANTILDSDAAFESTGSSLLGKELMQEVGTWKPPFVPDWQVQRRQLGVCDHALMMLAAPTMEQAATL